MGKNLMYLDASQMPLNDCRLVAICSAFPKLTTLRTECVPGKAAFTAISKLSLHHLKISAFATDWFAHAALSKMRSLRTLDVSEPMPVRMSVALTTLFRREVASPDGFL